LDKGVNVIRRKKKDGDGTSSKESRSAPPVTLFPDEAIVMVAHPARVSNLPKVVASLGLYELWRKRNTTVLTDRRILFGSGIFQRTEQSVPLANVIDASFTRKGVNSYAELTVSHRGRNSVRHVGPMSSSTARQLVSEILRRT
jgi:hypothetical protein